MDQTGANFSTEHMPFLMYYIIPRTSALPNTSAFFLDSHLTSISQALKCIVVEIELLSLRLARSLSLIPAQHSTGVLRGAAYPGP